MVKVKKAINIIIGLFLVVSCENGCKKDVEFNEFYFNMIDTITAYGKLFDTDEEVPLIMERSSQFYNFSNYLEYLTSHEFHYIVLDYHPVYQNQSDLKIDIDSLKKWYQKNKCGMTKTKADSIVNAKYMKIDGKGYFP